MKAMIALLFIVLSGCATTSGPPLNKDFINSIEVGETTLSQAKRELGEPLSLSKSANGDITINWGYAKVSGFADLESEGIDITFSPDGTVKDYKYQTNAP